MQRDFINLPILFLDFDGVLHPDEVYRIRGKGLFLRAPGMHLFQYVEHLSSILAKYPEVHIVLSTSWVKEFGFDKAKSYLPQDIQDKIIGGTYHRREAMFGGWARDWPLYTRYQQIQQWLDRKNVTSWVALDNDCEGWPVNKYEHLVPSDDWKGLSQLECQKMLDSKLEHIVNEWKIFNGMTESFVP